MEIIADCEKIIEYDRCLEIDSEYKRIIKEEGNYKYQILYTKSINSDNPSEELVDEIKIKGSYIKDTAFEFYNYDLKFDFVDGVDWEGLAKYYGVEIEGSIGYNNPHVHTAKPKMRDCNFYAQVVNQDKYIEINKIGEHQIIKSESKNGPTFP